MKKKNLLIEKAYVSFFDDVKEHVTKKISNKTLAEDITQEVFEKCLTELDNNKIYKYLTNDIQPLKPLLFSYTDDIISYHTQIHIEHKNEVNTTKTLKSINKTIQSKINERYRDILTMKYIKNYTAEEIIDILGLESRTAYNNLVKNAKNQLAKLILAIILLVTVSATTTYAIKKIYIKFKENPFDNKKQVSFVVPNATPEPTEFTESTDEEFIPHMPAYIPKSYKLSDKMSTSTSHLATYTSDDDTITYVQMPFSSAVSIDNNLKIVSETTKNDITYYYMTRDDTQLATIHMLTWSDGNYQYQITSQKLKEKELVKIAESIQIEK